MLLLFPGGGSFGEESSGSIGEIVVVEGAVGGRCKGRRNRFWGRGVMGWFKSIEEGVCWET